MPLFTKDDKKVIFIHIPKTAGTSIEYAFMDAQYKDKFLIINARGDTGNTTPCHPQHYQYGLLERFVFPEVGTGIEEFALVRNPFTRCISEYFWMGGGQPQNYNDTFFEGLVKYIESNLKSYESNEKTWQENKDNFITNNQRFHADNHWRPQWHFMGVNTKIYKYEEYGEKVFPELKEKYGLSNLPSKYTNVSLDLGRPSKFPDSIKLTQGFKDLYLKHYKKDHRLYGYDLPFIQE